MLKKNEKSEVYCAFRQLKGWLLNSRYTEYRQDAFAHQLGSGLELKQVLKKILDTSPPQRVDQYSTIIRTTHPIIHNRIRRLEKLSGLRR
jgi:Zn-dependent protease with chaperone function